MSDPHEKGSYLLGRALTVWQMRDSYMREGEGWVVLLSVVLLLGSVAHN